ncbi:AraC family transcriptional regulator [Flavobacterium akiainvivens]|uniref:AraC family transcriptional regulator n=1 Tax=Flavobacterium akiainvivens TaxID=1202724 RepID=A0A0M8M8I6_9FLAO|nr:AraC family transcriptional regulator [Flavobacterium akiainvivens]KOS05743.1 AraC family transcriptional regulator [Flavobacterium akiainvivens]SFQ37703.1 AraC-type DNA-binding protein [Flavobacterium akiainvivens]
MASKKAGSDPIRFKTLSDVMKASGFPPPQHPLITLLNGVDRPVVGIAPKKSHVLSYYKIAFKPNAGGKLIYGHTKFDFKEGGLFFIAPQQMLSSAEDNQEKDIDEPKVLSPQITLLIDPDFLVPYPLGQKINQYHFFSYATSETLHLSEREKETIVALFRNIEEELENRIDEMSHDVIVSQLELLLTYAQRFYKRQFLTRKQNYHSLTERIDQLLEEYFSHDMAMNNGIPTINYLADHLHMSASYLSDLLRNLTGKNTQQLIHDKMIYHAKNKLATTNSSISEIAFELGFEQPQSFSRLFKLKTKQTPQQYRTQFN